jgi:SHOCT-like domain
MSDQTRRILDLLAGGRITADEADRLLAALQESGEESPAGPAAGGEANRAAGRFLRIEVQKTGTGGQPPRRVNIRVPLTVVRSGLRLGALLGGFKGDRGSGRFGRLSERLRANGVDVDFDQLDADKLEALLRETGEVTLDIDDGRAQVRVTQE